MTALGVLGVGAMFFVFLWLFVWGDDDKHGKGK